MSGQELAALGIILGLQCVWTEIRVGKVEQKRLGGGGDQTGPFHNKRIWMENAVWRKLLAAATKGGKSQANHTWLTDRCFLSHMVRAAEPSCAFPLQPKKTPQNKRRHHLHVSCSKGRCAAHGGSVGRNGRGFFCFLTRSCWLMICLATVVSQAGGNALVKWDLRNLKQH